MLTHEENDLLCRVEGDAPMGQLMRRHWQPACLSEEVARARRRAGARAPARRGPRRVPRHRRPRRRARTSICPHRRASLVFGRNEECGLRCLYHGWKMDVDGNVLEMASEPAGERLGEEGEAQGVSDARSGRLRVGRTWARRRRCPNSGRRRGRRRRDTRVSDRQGASCRATGRRSSKARSTRRTARACIRPTCCRPTSTARMATDKALAAPVDRQGAAPAGGARPATAFATRRCGGPITNAATHDYVRSRVFVAPATALIPPNDRYNVANINVPMRRHAHDVLFHRLEPSGEHGRRHGGVAHVSRQRGRRRPRRQLPAAAHAREQLLAGPRSDEARQLHRHHRHSRTRTSRCGRRWGRSPIARASGSARATSRSSSFAADGRCGRARSSAASRAIGTARADAFPAERVRLPGDRAEDRRLAHAARRSEPVVGNAAARRRRRAVAASTKLDP